MKRVKVRRRKCTKSVELDIFCNKGLIRREVQLFYRDMVNRKALHIIHDISIE